MADRVHSSYLMGEAGHIMIRFDATMNPPIHKMLDGENVLHIEAVIEGFIYLPPTVKASGYFYSITSLGRSTQNTNIITQELDTTIVVLQPCSTVLLYCDGLSWYEVPITLKGA